MALTKPRAYQIYDIDYKQAVRVVSTATVTLSGGAPNSVDGVGLSLNDRVLVTGQSNKAQNGIYYVTTVGSGSNGTWARSVDANTTGEVLAGMIVMVTEGGQYADTQWKLLTDDPIVIGTTELTFAQNFGVPYTAATVPPTANVVVGSQWFNTDTNILYEYMYDGTSYYWIDLTGPAIGANGVMAGSVLQNGTSNVNVSFNGNISAVVGGTGITEWSSTGQYTTGLISATGNITGGNLLTGGQVVSTGNITGGNLLTGGQVVSTGNITGGNLLTGGQVVSTGNITGGNLSTAGLISATGTITSVGGTNGTAFAVGNSAVSNVALGFFPTAGTPGEYAIRDYSTVTSTMYFDVGMGGTANGVFQFRTTSSYSTLATINIYGITLTTNRPAFRVYGGGTTNNLTTTQNGTGALTGNNWTTDYTQGTGLNSTTGVFTAPVAGLYQINVVGRNSGISNSISQLAVMKNATGGNGAGGAVQLMIEWAASSTMNHVGGGTVSRLAVNDTLALKVLAGQINFDGNDSWSIAYLG